MNAGQVIVFELICPRFWLEQAKKLEIYEKNMKKKYQKLSKMGIFLDSCHKIKGIKVEITTW